MVRNRRLARHIAGLGMAELRRQLDYKTRDAGVRLVVADRWYPSSKTCSACGAVRAKLTLAQREFVCESCGARLDLADEVASEPSCGRTENEPAGNPPKTAPGGNGYRHGKAQSMSQGHHREVATP
jgi:putative transposase